MSQQSKTSWAEEENVKRFEQLEEYQEYEKELLMESDSEVLWGEEEYQARLKGLEIVDKAEVTKKSTPLLREFSSRIRDFAKDQNFFYPDYSKPYQPMAPSIEHFSWVNVFMGEYPVKTPKMHYQIIDLLSDENVEESAIEIHREGAKTTVVTEQNVTKALQSGEFLGYGKVTNIIIFSATRAMVVDIFKNIKAARDNNDKLYETMPLATTRDGKVIADRENEICIRSASGNNVYVQARSAGESMRGTRREGVRPQVVIFDDILSDDQIYSEEARQKIKIWKAGVVIPACNSSVMRVTPEGTEVRRKIITVGTPMADNDAVRTALKSKYTTGLFLPLVQNFGTRRAISNWKGLHPLHEVKRLYNMAVESNTLPEFNRERLLKVRDESTAIFKDKYFKEWDYEKLKEKFPRMVCYTTMDMAIAQKEKNDRVVLMTIAVDPAGRWYRMRTDAGRKTPREVISILFEHMITYGSLKFKAEAAALQQVLDYFIKEEQERRGIYFPVETLKNNSTQSKVARVMALEPRFASGRILLNPMEKEHNEQLKKQLKGLTPSGFTTKLKDDADCLANFTDPGFIEEAFATELDTDFEFMEHSAAVLPYG